MALHLDLVDLRLFVHIADHNSLTKGAGRSHLSLPAASVRIENLEESIGTKLLYRSSQGVTLTPPGQALAHHARQVWSASAETRSSPMPTRRADLPPNVEPEQVWKDPGGHYRVESVTNGVASLHRCTPGGRVLNQRYKETASVERMQGNGSWLAAGRFGPVRREAVTLCRASQRSRAGAQGWR